MLLTLGVLLWAATHLFVSVGAAQRARIIGAIGVWPYKGLFALVLVGALALIVTGWKAMPPTALWNPPGGMRHLTMLLMPFAVILFFSARMPTDIKRLIRHPQLTGVKLWAFAHLLSNGETRSVILFGGMLAWAVLEVIFINRRDGARVRPEPVGLARTVISAVIGLILTAVLVWGHPWFTGMPIIPAG
ncbi:MAG: NnrU family protein [Nevskiales bacterium]|nr:NnrU family protein [Nevskiales bacterium]